MSQAQTATVRPKPKPRPRPLPKTTSNSASASTSGPSTSASKITYENVKDDDEMFMRNHGRGKDGWAKLRKISKDGKTKKVATSPAPDSDNDNSTHKSSSKRRKEYRSPLKLPRWQTDKKFARILSQDLSDGDTDSDASVTLEDNDTVNDNKLKRKRTYELKRARSKSITPPPAIPQYQLEHVKEAIKKTLGEDRQCSPEVEDTFEEDTFAYDPQLAKIAQIVKSQSTRIGHTSSSVELSGGNDIVDITVKWEPHPLNEHGRRDNWGFRMSRSDNFSDLFESVAEEANVLVDKLIMTYRGNRFFSSITPQTLNIWSAAEIVACDLPTHEYKRKLALEQLRSEAEAKTKKPEDLKDLQSNILEIDDSDEDEDSGASPPHSTSNRDKFNVGAGLQTDTPAIAGGDDEDEDKFKLVLRSSLTPKDITLNVRSTTKCGAIVKAFLKKAGLAEKYPAVFDPSVSGNGPQKKKSRKSVSTTSSNKMPKLCIDGDKVGNDTEIGEYDLEEGDMVDVVEL